VRDGEERRRNKRRGEEKDRQREFFSLNMFELNVINHFRPQEC
jgi:hypothetical protein